MYSETSKEQLATIENREALELKDKQIQIDKLESAKRNREFVLGIVLLLVIIAVVLTMFNTQIKANRLLAKEKKAHLQHIQAQTEVLSDIAYKQSHEVRAPVATILGLVQLFNFDDPVDPINKEVIEGLAEATESLDIVVKEVIRIENSLSSANNNYI